MAENEDIDYTVSDHATPEDDRREDEDQPYKGVLVEVQTLFDDAIKHYDTLDVIDLTESEKMTPTQQVAVYRKLVTLLKTVKTNVDNKLKELV